MTGLQNHPGEREFPVRPRWRYVPLARARRNADSRGRARRLLTVVASLVVGVGLMVLAFAAAGWWLPSELRGQQLVMLILTIPLLVVATVGIVSVLADMWLPIREQRSYIRLAGREELSLSQQQILAVVAPSNFGGGLWNASLEPYPALIRMPERVQRRITRRGGERFLTFGLVTPQEARWALDRSYDIANQQDAVAYLDRAFAENSVSLRMVDMLSGPHAESFAQRIGTLTGISADAVHALGRPSGNRPAALAWAGDAMHAAAVTRECFVAGYLDEQAAWEYLGTAAEVAFTVHDSYEEVWAARRVFLAAATDSLEAIEVHDAVLAEFRASRWPAVSVPFTKRPTGLTLPATVANLQVLNRPDDRDRW